jgi:hypothetical protein
MNVTFFTTAQVVISPGPGGSTEVKVLFSNVLQGSLAKYSVNVPYQLETDGAVIESYGPGGVTLEIIDINEFKSRFPDHVAANVRLANATHFCRLTGVGTGKESCVSQNCDSGVCNMHAYPKYCSCD